MEVMRFTEKQASLSIEQLSLHHMEAIVKAKITKKQAG
jgi:hypothetical protein